MNKDNIYQLFMASLLVLAGCAQSQPDESANTKTGQMSEIKSSPLNIPQKSNMEAKKGKTDKRYFAFNNQKFRTGARSIKAGVKVFDGQLNSYAYVTNKVVAVLVDSSQFKEKTLMQALVTNSKIVTNANVDFHFVTDGVVEIIFKNRQVDMLAMYKVISALPNVSQAELLLKYQGRIPAQEY